MKKKSALFLGLVLAMGTVLTACGSSDAAGSKQSSQESAVKSEESADTEESTTVEESTVAGETTGEETSEEVSGVQVTPPSTLLEEGTLTYAINANFPPFEYLDENQEMVGFDVEYVAAMADLMGLEVEIVDMQWDNLITSLQAGRVDIVNSAVYVNDERKEVVDFVPYMYIGESILVAGDSAYDFTDVEGLSGLKVGAISGSIEETFISGFNEQFEAEGKDLIDIHSLPSLNDSLVSVASGQLDATLTSSSTAAYLEIQQPGVYKVIGTFGLDTEIGICVKKGDTEMAEALTKCAEILHENGTYAELMKKYGLQEELDYFK